ncbi:MAG TPA: hypothetical protein VM008_07675 [Phycisphaerae bacterium]|nr:hypothetical protein [Phycisphaerae bacterium]
MFTLGRRFNFAGMALSWIIEHWIGTFHALARTALATASWYLFPGSRFVAVAAVIVAIYAVPIVVLEARSGSASNGPYAGGRVKSWLKKSCALLVASQKIPASSAAG